MDDAMKGESASGGDRSRTQTYSLSGKVQVDEKYPSTSGKYLREEEL